MKIEQIDAQISKTEGQLTKEKVVKDETVTLTINGNISRSMLQSKIRLRNLLWDTVNENMVKSSKTSKV